MVKNTLDVIGLTLSASRRHLSAAQQKGGFVEVAVPRDDCTALRTYLTHPNASGTPATVTCTAHRQHPQTPLLSNFLPQGGNWSENSLKGFQEMGSETEI
jgi:hypothetical protein